MEQFFKLLIGSHNFLQNEEAEHERARKMLNPAFHFIRLQSMISIMIEQTIKAINELLLLSSQHQVVDLQSKLNALTLTVTASSAFGKGFETIANVKQIVYLACIEVLEVIEYQTILMINHIPLIAQLSYW
ncbi:unnamed protein product [Rotaria sordida]|uniref:Cytochrome P450 n=1 Tax=Rotaria sordida TaxID=392033 RepID=A0A816AI46_9BILA|nr:unnamed protein product [Rotaria sordida]CAF1598432.1 unnamed protein product [Rotaria sordida]